MLEPIKMAARKRNASALRASRDLHVPRIRLFFYTISISYHHHYDHVFTYALGINTLVCNLLL
jgi:hypothetical protein